MNNGFSLGAGESSTASIAPGTKFEQYTQYRRPTTMIPSGGKVAGMSFLTAPGIFAQPPIAIASRGTRRSVREYSLKSTHKKSELKGIGLYSYEQQKNSTAFDYFGEIVVGTIIASVGGLSVYSQLTVRSEEIRQYGSAKTHVWGWIMSVAVVVIGLFISHAGVIFTPGESPEEFSAQLINHTVLIGTTRRD